MKTNATTISNKSITARNAVVGLARRAGVTLLAFIVVLLALGTDHAHAQSSITSPSTSAALPLPSFTLNWNYAGQVETYIWLGSQMGAANYYAGSMGTSSSTTFTWPGAPASCWVRLWSRMPVYSSTSGSTVAYYQWQGRDYFFSLGKLPSDRLVEALIQRFQADNGKWGGQCKSYLSNAFASVVSQTGIKTPSGIAPFMPSTIAGYYWANDTNSGFMEILKVYPGDTNKLEAIKTLLRQVKKGDVIQYGTQVSVDEGLHSLAITADYNGSGIIQWADSNWTPNTVNAYQSRSINDLAAIIAKDATLSNPAGNYPKGATLYRVRRDLKQ